MVHTGFCHQQGTHQLLTGFPERVLRPKPLYPDLFSITNKIRYAANSKLPKYVGVAPVNFTGSSYLGNRYDTFAVPNDPNLDDFAVSNIQQADTSTVSRLSTRIGLRKQLDQLKRKADYLNQMAAVDSFEQQAFNVLTGSEA